MAGDRGSSTQPKPSACQTSKGCCGYWPSGWSRTSATPRSTKATCKDPTSKCRSEDDYCQDDYPGLQRCCQEGGPDDQPDVSGATVVSNSAAAAPATVSQNCLCSRTCGRIALGFQEHQPRQLKCESNRFAIEGYIRKNEFETSGKLGFRQANLCALTCSTIGLLRKRPSAIVLLACRPPRRHA